MAVEHHITIGKQLINRIGVKAIHSQSCHCEECKRRGNPVRTAPHKNRPPPCIRTSTIPCARTSTTPCHCEPQSGAAIQSEPVM